MSEQNTASGEGGSDPVALAAAIDRSSPDVDTELVAYLRDQRSHMHETLKQIHLDIFEKWLGMALRLATLVVGLAAAAGVALMVWDASQSRGLLIEPFAVPPDLAARGLTGQVVASQVLDKLTTMDNATQSYRAAQSYTNNWGNDIKVEIPETGVSIGEFRRFLREWLGHDIHISGEVWRTDSGIAISARTSGDTGATFNGAQSDMDALVQKAAEHVYAQTQPFRYGNYLRPQGRFKESYASYLRLTTSESAREQGWAWYGIGVLAAVWQGKTVEGLWGYRKAIAAYPKLPIAWSGTAQSEFLRGHLEAALQARLRVEKLVSRDTVPDIAPRAVDFARAQWTHTTPQFVGDYDEALRRGRRGMAMPDQQGFRGEMRVWVARALALNHETTAAQEMMRDAPWAIPGSRSVRMVTPIIIEAVRENWRRAAQAETAAEQVLSRPELRLDFPVILAAQLRPWAALASAKLGDIAGLKRSSPPRPAIATTAPASAPPSPP